MTDNEVSSADKGNGVDAVPESSTPEPDPNPVIAQIVLAFHVDGAIEANFVNAKGPHMWAGAHYLDTIGDRMWNDARDQQVAMAVQQQREVAAAQKAIDDMKRKARGH